MYKYYDLFDAICFILIYFICLVPRWKNNRRYWFLKTILYVYLCFMFYFTLMPFIIPIPYINFNISSANIHMIPFGDILQGHGGAVRELLLNIIMMLPLGFLLPFIYKKSCFTTIKCTFGFSLLIEMLQIFSYGGLRSFDMTDLLSNTLGGILGYLLYLLFRPMLIFLANKIFKDDDNDKIPWAVTKGDVVLFGLVFVQLLIRSVVVSYL